MSTAAKKSASATNGSNKNDTKVASKEVTTTAAPGVQKNVPAKPNPADVKAQTILVYETQMRNLKAHHVAKRVELRKVWVKSEGSRDLMAKHWESLSQKAQSEFIKRSVDGLVAEAIANHKQQKQATKEVSKTEALIRVCVADVVEGGKGSVGKKFMEKDGLGEILEMIVFSKENSDERLKLSKMEEMMKILAEEEETTQDDSEEEKELNKKLSLEIRSAYICEWATKVVRRLAEQDSDQAPPKRDDRKGKGKAN